MEDHAGPKNEMSFLSAQNAIKDGYAWFMIIDHICYGKVTGQEVALL